MTQTKPLASEERYLFERVAEVCHLELATPPHYLTDDGHSPYIRAELERSGVDAMGIYNRRTDDVTLYVAKCSQTAREFRVSPRDIELIVLAHEWAHFVQHRGRHPDLGVAWEGFPKLPQGLMSDAEDLAEKAAFMALHGISGGKRLQELQAQLAAVSPLRYRNWLADYADWLANGVPPDAAVNDLRNKMRFVRDLGKEPTLTNMQNFDE